MPKNLFEDMVRIKREERQKAGLTATPRPTKNERYVPILEPEESEPKPVRNVPERNPNEVENKYASVYEVTGRENKKGTRYTMWFVAGISVLFLLFALSYLFAGAKVVITPKVQNVNLDETFTASKDGGEEELSFDLVVLSGAETKTVVGGVEQDVFKRAKGSVIIYNDYSSAPQNLDIDTRLEGSNGKIYKTETKTTVPGKKGTTPGSVSVNIYASEPGEEYNSGPIDFKIFGFKGGPKYAKFYARSKDKISGGFKGKGTVISEEEEAAAVKELTTALQANLSKKAGDQIPAGFILFKDAGILATETPINSGGEFTVNGTFYGFLLDEKKLTQKLAEEVIPDYDGSEVYIQNIQNIPFTLSNRAVALKDASEITFKLTGGAKIVSKVDTAKFLADIVGTPKKDFEQILSTYPSIASTKNTIRPVWKFSFPDNESDIVVTVEEPQ